MGRVKPTALLRLEKGKLYDKQRDREECEPKPKRDVRPRCPRRFTPEERKAWRSFAAVLDNYGLLTAANATQLELLAKEWVQYLRCTQMVDQTDIVVRNAGGHARNPWFVAQKQLSESIERKCQNLGLSSVALAKIGSLIAAKAKKGSEFFDD